MAAEPRRYVIWLGLQLVDAGGYAEYRRQMAPVLARYGGDFEYDFTVAQVLRQPGDQPIDRVFSIAFPNRRQREAFFADPEYRAIRAAHFEPSVRAITSIASYERDG